MDCCFGLMDSAIEKTMTPSRTRYYGRIGTGFMFRNDFFLCPPFYNYKILEDYDKEHTIIKETDRYYYGDELADGAGYEIYNRISFLEKGIYTINIQNLRTDNVQTYTFVIV